MRTRIAFASALALALGAQSAWTQQFTPPTFEGLDTNKNGSLSKEEVTAYVATIGAGRGGAGGAAPNADEIFGRWDTNTDGMVSKEEFDSRPARGRGGPPGAARGAAPATPPAEPPTN